MNPPVTPSDRPWAILYTKAAKTHVFARYTSRPDAETAAQRLRRIMPDGTLEVCWDDHPKG
jgi:hypothetical protein